MIIVHNRSWSAPLQTVHSVINCEPRPMLEESVLVDDREMGRRKHDWTTPFRTPTMTGIIFRKLECKMLEWFIEKEKT
eukprot:bmy_02883T0